MTAMDARRSLSGPPSVEPSARRAYRRLPLRAMSGVAVRGRRFAATVAMALVTSTLLVTPVLSADAATPAVALRARDPSPAGAVSTSPEMLLSARLATEYAGAVPAASVESLVRGVSRQLRRDASPPERLLRTTEAVCRRALTDFLARGVRLPVG